jgi:type IV pilus assembly protein PilM
MPALALDIGTYTIKAISGNPGKVPEILRVVEVFNPLGVSLPTDDNQMEKLGQTIDTLIKDNNFTTTDVRLALPETVVSTKVISLPRLTDAELASAINWQAEQHIPIPPEELSLEYQVLYRPPKNDPNAQMRVLLVGVRKSIIERYIALFTSLGIEPALLETQTLSVIRSAQFEVNDPTTLVIHIGASTMNMAIVHQGQIEFVITHLSGGQVLTRALEQQIGLDAAQAEGYKRTYGLDESQFQGKVRQSLVPGVKVMVSEFAKAIRFFASQHPSDAVKRVLLSGGAAQLPGFFQLITQELGVEVLLAAPFAQTKGVAPETNHPALTVCVGLLMRET